MNEFSGNDGQKAQGGFMSRFSKRPERKDQPGVLYGSETETGSVLSGGADDPERSSGASASVGTVSAVRRGDSRNGNEKNVLTESLVIEGNVISDTDIMIRGTVKGNVSCRSDIELSGEVTGNIEGRNIRITGGGVRGDIQAGEMLSIDRCQIKGDLSAAHARVNNSIEGDITVSGTLTLQREANIQGNIVAAGLSVEEGASMNGQITISRNASAASKPSVSHPVPKLSAGVPESLTAVSASTGNTTVTESTVRSEGGESDRKITLSDDKK